MLQTSLRPTAFSVPRTITKHHCPHHSELALPKLEFHQSDELNDSIVIQMVVKITNSPQNGTLVKWKVIRIIINQTGEGLLEMCPNFSSKMFVFGPNFFPGLFLTHMRFGAPLDSSYYREKPQGWGVNPPPCLVGLMVLVGASSQNWVDIHRMTQ